MIFTRLMITNLGVYRGRHEFELRPQAQDENTPPIVLFGGKNGAGKSTLLEAIRLCLYGRIALGARIRRTDYETHIRQRMHRQANGLPVSSASVGLVFEHVHAGVMSTYDAVRSWRIDSSHVQEDVSIYKNGIPFTEIAPEHWNDFLRDLIPPGLADLFFFDGEQIQALADHEREAETLGNAVRGLLNLDLIEKLQADLMVYLRQQNPNNPSKLQQTAQQADEIAASLEEQISARRQDLAQIQSHIDYTLAQAEKVRQRLLSEGAAFIQQRDSITHRQKEVERELEQTREAIRELATGLLPFAVSPIWAQRLRGRLIQEAEAEKQQVVFQTQHEQAAQAAMNLLKPNFQKQVAPDVDAQSWAKIAAALQQMLQPTQVEDIGPVRHAISENERSKLLGWIDETTHHIPGRLHELSIHMEALEDEQIQLARALKQIPTEDVAIPLLDEFHRVVEKKGRLDSQFEQISAELRQLDFQLAQAERERKAAWEQFTASDAGNSRTKRAGEVQKVLDQYLKQITELKMRELEHAIAQYFNLLCRKRMFVREVKINPEQFTVTLYGANRMVLPKSELSAGEKQLYATALLWALRSVSGRALPIIIDTPMGRLDTDHRTTMLKSFFPNAAHQVILLSTDTEIDPNAFRLIQHAISHTFRLEFDQDEGCTKVERSYFSAQPEARLA